MHPDVKAVLEEIPPGTSLSAEAVKRLLRQRELDSIEHPPGASPRNTYKASHAHKLRPYFVEAIEHRKNVCVPFADFNCKAKRMHAIVCDSLLWLIHNDDSAKWATFKTQISFRISSNADEGIWIEWRTAEAPGRAKSVRGIDVVSAKESTVDFMAQVIAWLESDREGMLRIESINLSVEKQQSVIKMFESAGCTQYKVEAHKIIAV